MRLEAFFAYANEREAIRLKKADGNSYPWTDDEILRRYKFTNIMRQYDQTSANLIRILYKPNHMADKNSILLNCALSRYFGRWEFAEAIGWQDYDSFDSDEIKEIVMERQDFKLPVFTGAYVITNGGISAPKQDVVLDYYIEDLYHNIPALVETAQMTRSWRSVAEQMRQIKGFGGSGFMTKETLLDTTYTGFWDLEEYQSSLMTHGEGFSYPKDWWVWTPVGPGARRGIARLLGHDDIDTADARRIGRDEKYCLQSILDICGRQSEFWKHEGSLSPTDVQFVLCEFDKYERVRLGQGRPRSTYKVKK